MVNRDPEEARESHTWCHLVRAPAYPPWLQAPHRTNRTYFLLSLWKAAIIGSFPRRPQRYFDWKHVIKKISHATIDQQAL